ncbi:hypothetical protein [Paraglaciecola psychrophila]|uniref:Uncharacterized protein n=1 Tax=Paraglaciecola psychrophila 170 TaxID=1129794 RepID=K7A399_9ALTE|nr:hypothetical protein [Paraglaciecola psychrophila]AGH44491.1 hypothetical protein C427_2382 [Paraglaciecola psychrophila 170]GAC36832.1 hypothetical protein GPSY_1195 [Paraglaciecola psychrophila 170]
MSKPITMLDLCKAHPEKAAERIDALIKRNAVLEKERDELRVIVSYLDAKITSASGYHERAIPFLLVEALERTHLDFHREALRGQL